MSDSNSNKIAIGGLEFARELQVKYEMYFTGLIFTLLAASIQTAKFSSYALQNAFELAGWLSLLVSGMVGLSRMEWLPLNHETQARLDIARTTNRELKAARASGRMIVNEDMQPWDVDGNIAKQDASIAEVAKMNAGNVASFQRKHGWRKWTFLIGLVLVVASRAFEPSITIWSQVQARVAVD